MVAQVSSACEMTVLHNVDVLNKYLRHCTDERCYKASLDWKPSNSCTLETEFRRQVALPVQCFFTARCFMNTAK